MKKTDYVLIVRSGRIEHQVEFSATESEARNLVDIMNLIGGGSNCRVEEKEPKK